MPVSLYYYRYKTMENRRHYKRILKCAREHYHRNKDKDKTENAKKMPKGKIDRSCYKVPPIHERNLPRDAEGRVIITDSQPSLGSLASLGSLGSLGV